MNIDDERFPASMGERFLLTHCVHEDIFLYKGQQFD